VTLNLAEPSVPYGANFETLLCLVGTASYSKVPLPLLMAASTFELENMLKFPFSLRIMKIS